VKGNPTSLEDVMTGSVVPAAFDSGVHGDWIVLHRPRREPLDGSKGKEQITKFGHSNM